MLYALLKGAALGISTAKVGALSYRRLLPLAAQAAVLAMSLGDELEATGASSVGEVAAAVSDGLQALAGQIMAEAETTKRAPVSDGEIRTARLPPLLFCRIEMSSDAMSTELREVAEKLAGKRYQFNGWLVALHERLSEAAARGIPADTEPPLRLCVAGGDATLHDLVQAYVVLRMAYPQLCAPASVAIYLVPLGSTNKLARFIASYDGWYRRHIYAPHAMGQPSVPYLILPPNMSHQSSLYASSSVSSSSIDSPLAAMHLGSSSGSLAPGSGASISEAPLLGCLTEYLRSAQAILPIVLFEVSCWVTSPPSISPTSSANGTINASTASTKLPTEPPFLTIAFCESLEVVAAPLAPGGQAAEGGSVRDPLLSMTVTYTMSDPRGVSVRLRALHCMFYHGGCTGTHAHANLAYHYECLIQAPS
jgi:hypothetical protein